MYVYYSWTCTALLYRLRRLPGSARPERHGLWLSLIVICGLAYKLLSSKSMLALWSDLLGESPTSNTVCLYSWLVVELNDNANWYAAETMTPKPTHTLHVASVFSKRICDVFCVDFGEACAQGARHCN